MQARLRAATVVGTVAVTLAAVGISAWSAAQDHQSLPGTAVDAAVVASFALVGAVIAGARPGNAIGWLMLAGGALWAIGGASVDVAYHGIVAHPGSVPGASGYAVSGSALRSVGWYLITIAVPVLFPDGHAAGGRWRWLVRAVPVLIIAAVLDPLTDPNADLRGFGTWRNPLGAGDWAHVLSFLAFLGHIPLAAVVAVGAIAQLVHRWRRGGAFVRQQLLLFATAVAVTIVAAPVSLALDASGWIFDVAALPLPFAIGFAVLARGLYDLRTAANRTLVWVSLSVGIASLYALVIAGFEAITHTDRSASWLPWAAAGVVAVLFSPARDVLQRGVNRLTFGRWDEPYDVLATLGQRVEQAGDADRLLADVVVELEGLGLHAVSIRDLTGRAIAGSAPPCEDTAVRVPLSAYGDLLGELCYRAPANPLRSRDRQLLDDLAGHLGGVLHAHRLTADLQRARERLVLAGEEERRRLRRDLHDGLGPALAGHLLRLDVLAAHVGPDAAAAAEVDTLRAELRGTMSDLRRLVEGLRPPALDDLGLVGSLEQATRRLTSGTSTVLTFKCPPLPPLPAATEVAAYRIVTEAVTNVTKHAAATRCQVSLHVADGSLRVCVEDDGQGLPDSSSDAGNGLQTMHERAAELRGRLCVTSGGDGVRVTAELPASPATTLTPPDRTAERVTR